MTTKEGEEKKSRYLYFPCTCSRKRENLWNFTDNNSFMSRTMFLTSCKSAEKCIGSCMGKGFKESMWVFFKVFSLKSYYFFERI